MTANRSVSRPRSSRKHGTAHQYGNLSEPSEAAAALRDAIEDERGRLMTAESILQCIVIVMNETDDVDGADYQTLVALARELVRCAIDGLDSVRLKPMLEQLRARGRYKVKEEATLYVH